LQGQKRIAIIGGGIAGLSTGIYAQKHGFRTTIYEALPQIGGVCAPLRTAGVSLEPTLRFLNGVREDTPLYRCWQETGGLQDTLPVTPDSFFTAEEAGATVNFCGDINEFLESTAACSPEDREQLKRFCTAVEKAGAFRPATECPPDLLSPLKALAGAAGTESGRLLLRLRTVSLQDYAQQFHHPALRCAFREVLPPGSTLAQLVFSYSRFLSGDLAVPVGGSAGIVHRMAKRYLAEGGQLRCKDPVKKIIAANGAARGIVLAGGEHMLTHWVIAACDPAYACRVLLQDRYGMEKKLQDRYCMPEKYTTCSLVRLFFSAPEESLPIERTLSFPTDVIPAEGDGISRLRVTQFSNDPTFVFNGRAELAVDFPIAGRQAFRRWKALAGQQAAYREEIRLLADSTRQALEKHFPQMQGLVQFLGCHTPADYARRFHNFHGSCTAFIPTAQARPAPLTGRLPGLSHLLLTGQWLGPTAGMHTALLQGKFTVQRICRDEHIP
jgi:phytoene desaturase